MVFGGRSFKRDINLGIDAIAQEPLTCGIIFMNKEENCHLT